MVWVYGGNFASGTASNPNYNGSTLVHTSSRLGQDVVVVTFNYRTGVFGFLASPEIQLAGGSNAGLRDQIAAFRWVRDHIDAFGGDPARVTAFGESAGSCSIATHLTGAHPPTASSPPLFDAAILQSAGVDFGYTFDWTTVYVTIHAAVASATQCADLACLQSLPASTLRTVQRALETSGTSFRPYVDGDYLPSTPRARLRAGTFMQVPVLVGTNTDEGTGFTTAVTRDQFDSLVTAAFPSLPQFLVAAIYANYPVADYATTRFGPDAAPFLAAADLIGDIGIQCPSQRVADAYARLSNATDPADGKPLVFRYRFNYLPSWIPESQAVGGVAHTYEIPFVFAASATMASASDTALAREMVSMWTFFAQSSGRNGMNGWLGQTVQWPKYQADPMLGAGGGRQVRIDGPGSYVVQLDTSRSAKCNFWNLLTAAISA
ncbi:Alpha/Beta hydrolase protein [Zopfochytrium polystomum]|nr:Alpha/Beta hydrolase protein [Zopfochytrium polystomum]